MRERLELEGRSWAFERGPRRVRRKVGKPNGHADEERISVEVKLVDGWVVKLTLPAYDRVRTCMGNCPSNGQG